MIVVIRGTNFNESGKTLTLILKPLFSLNLVVWLDTFYLILGSGKNRLYRN